VILRRWRDRRADRAVRRVAGLRPLVAVCAAPAIWLGHLSVVYALAPHACRWGLPGLLHVITVGAAVLTALAVVHWRAEARALLADAGRATGEGAADVSGPVLTRQGGDVLIGVAVGMAALFTLVVAVAGISVAVIGPCR
jgi:hypothetical protein